MFVNLQILHVQFMLTINSKCISKRVSLFSPDLLLDYTFYSTICLRNY